VHWLVDGMNVIGSRPDGWWRDRPGAQRRLVRELSGLVERPGADEVTVTVVFDGRPPAGPPAHDDGAVRVVYAPGGPDAADDVIAEMAASVRDRSAAVVVTSDAGLARRVRRTGVAVVGVRAFRAALGPPE